MNDLHLKATQYTPEISLNASGTISMEGKSYPENTFDFYQPIIDWLEEFLETASAELKLSVKMEIIYFNSSSSKLFFDFFDRLEAAQIAGREVDVNWIYDAENESALEAGEDFKEDFETLVINLVEK